MCQSLYYLFIDITINNEIASPKAGVLERVFAYDFGLRDESPRVKQTPQSHLRWIKERCL